MATPTDPNYGLQGQYNLIGDIETIWDEYNGAGVHVAIFDDGVESDHPDLAANYDDSIDFTYNGVTYDQDPIGSGDAHGTACAGIIGAVGSNGLGGAGVAWGVTITGVNYLVDIQDDIFAGGGFDTGLLQAAMEHSANFDVVSNSWGSTPQYAGFQNLNTFSSASITAGGFEFASLNGRGGLGTIINQAAGNDTLNLNGSGVNATRFTTSVAATDLAGNVEDYSNWGTALLIAAPAVNYTTDLTGADGYTGDDYVQGFNGTSAATPVVSGVTALMLQAESGLGWRDVQNILAISAAHTGSAFGATGSGFEVGDWFANGAGNWNGGGMSFHLSYGFGMLDAFAAVRMAEAWLTLFDEAQTSTNEISATYDGGSLVIPTTGTSIQQTTIVVPGNESITIEDISVTIDATHSYSGDVRVTLIAPDGTRFDLFLFEGGATSVDFVWTFGITGALGMVSEGTWTLEIEDNFDGDGGTLDDWDLTFYGTEENTNDVYHFTQDHLDYVAQDASRAALDDTNGGNDWINMAAIAGKIVANLNSGKTITVDNVVWSTLGSSRIENFYAGDGDDRIIATSRDNVIYGGRGNDRIETRGGDDILVGGAGRDILNGGDDYDIASYVTAKEGVIVDLDNLNANRGDARRDVYIDIEEIVGSDFDDTIRGTNAEGDILFGGAGDDRITGRGGEDILGGGEGDDVLIAGNDDDILVGGAGADELIGGSGSDTASYADATVGVRADLLNSGTNTNDAAGDTYSRIENLAGSDFDDYLYGDHDDNVLSGGEGRDRLVGRNGDDTLDGGAGADFLTGGGGADVMTGGDDSNADRFIFSDISDSGTTTATRDRITDFGSGEDIIDLSAIDANSLTGGDDAFSFLGTGAFTNTAGELRYSVNGSGNATVMMDVDGDGIADMEIRLTDVSSLVSSDFIL